jgi:hypothetical protein
METSYFQTWWDNLWWRPMSRPAKKKKHNKKRMVWLQEHLVRFKQQALSDRLWNKGRMTKDEKDAALTSGSAEKRDWVCPTCGQTWSTPDVEPECPICCTVKMTWDTTGSAERNYSEGSVHKKKWLADSAEKQLEKVML